MAMEEDWWRVGVLCWPFDHSAETTGQREARLASGGEYQRIQIAQKRRGESWELMELQQRYWRRRLKTLVEFRQYKARLGAESFEERELWLKGRREYQAARLKRIRETESADEKEARLKGQREYKAIWWKRRKKEMEKGE